MNGRWFLQPFYIFSVYLDRLLSKSKFFSKKEIGTVKRIVAIALALALMAALAACGTKDATPAPEQEPVQQEQNTEPEVQQEQQESAIDYTGGYQDRISQRATMSIVTDGSDTLGFGISWSNSAFETNEWTMSGKLSEDGTRVDYTDGRMVTTSYGEPG